MDRSGLFFAAFLSNIQIFVGEIVTNCPRWGPLPLCRLLPPKLLGQQDRRHSPQGYGNCKSAGFIWLSLRAIFVCDLMTGYALALSQSICKDQTMTATTVFTNNRSQAIRLPAELRLPDSVKRVDVRARL